MDDQFPRVDQALYAGSAAHLAVLAGVPVNPLRRFFLLRGWPGVVVRDDEIAEYAEMNRRLGLVYFVRVAPGIFLSVYRIERNGARKKGERWARLRAFRNAAWVCLSLPPFCYTRLRYWLAPRWARTRWPERYA
jgi:hypothetical protein